MNASSLTCNGNVLELVIGEQSLKCVIPKGDRGAPGRDGISIKGETGSQGVAGLPGRDSIVPGAQGATGATGEAGARGITPKFKIGSVTAGESANVIISGTPEEPELHFVLPRGVKGDLGQAGLPGRHGSHEYADTMVLGQSPRFTSDMLTRYCVADGLLELPEMTENDCGKWLSLKTFTNLGVIGLVESSIALAKNESAKLVVIPYGDKFLFTRF